MAEENKKELTMSMDLKKLGEAYNIPFQEILNTIKADRDLALQNYEILKQKLTVEDDDTSAAKEQLNKAMELIIASTEKLTSLMSSASKLWGDSVKALAMQNSKTPSATEIEKMNSERRKKILDEDDEQDK